MSASTLNGRDSRIIPKMLLPPTINRFALHVHQLEHIALTTPRTTSTFRPKFTSG